MIQKSRIEIFFEFAIRKYGVSYLVLLCIFLFSGDISIADKSAMKLSWEIPGRISIFDLQLGPAVKNDDRWIFLGNNRKLSAAEYNTRLTLMVRFSYKGTRPDAKVRIVVKLPEARQHEEQLVLRNLKGEFSYAFTIHEPEEFIGNGSVYLYYGFNLVEVLGFTITSGT